MTGILERDSTAPVGVGVIGCGYISGAYLSTLSRLDGVRVVACADMDEQRARDRAAEFGVARAGSVASLLGDDEVQIVLNLTIPAAHADVALAAIAAGKHVYTEKPLALDREQGLRVLSAAAERGVLVGGAPDTFMGAGLQTSRALLDAGGIGTVVGGAAAMHCRGHEFWHPDPAFYYARGGGPLFDMGPYYITALVALLGPVASVSGATRITFAERLITSQPRAGTTVPVEVPSHVAALLEFASGPVVTLVTSFDICATAPPPIQLFGTDGALSIPDPNTFGGEPQLFDPSTGWVTKPHTHPHDVDSRGLGVLDMASALRTGARPRADGSLTMHVLDVMQSIHESGERGRRIDVSSTCERPAPMPAALDGIDRPAAAFDAAFSASA
jgi:predicted dehydrogenase